MRWTGSRLRMDSGLRVPALEDDAFVLFESTGIINYLEATRRVHYRTTGQQLRRKP
jgi:glutathione S-transferase